jgi:hypothetical protein
MTALLTIAEIVACALLFYTVISLIRARRAHEAAGRRLEQQLTDALDAKYNTPRLTKEETDELLGSRWSGD